MIRRQHAAMNISRMRGPALAGAVASFLLLGSACSAEPRLPSAIEWDGSVLRIPVAGGAAVVDPATLAVDYTAATGRTRSWSGPVDEPLGTPSVPVVDGDSVSWTYADRGLDVRMSQGDRLDVDVSSTDGELAWPVSAADTDTRSVEFPNGEGQSVPVDDPFWLSEEAGLAGSSWDFAGGLTMPFWGTSTDDSGVSYVVETDIGTSLDFSAETGRLRATATHRFDAGRDTGTYSVAIAPTDGNPVAAAQDYRAQLLAVDGITTLDEKIARNPEVAKLVGALHAYTWGDGREAAIVGRLQELGIERAWLGYDADGAPMDPAAVAAAEQAGFLVGPYDTWDNAQDPADADTESSVWPGDIWPAGCVTDEAGDPVGGFGGRGCYVSTAALDAAQEASGVLSGRVADFTANGADSYFLDVDAAGQLFRDFSPAHRQTEAEDRNRRLNRMLRLSEGAYSGGVPLVLGSETAAAWANPALAYSHGSSTPLTDSIWAFQKDREQYGAYWPEERPAFFFKPAELPEALARAMFDPRYRVPLYETVLHDSVVSTDRWEMGLFKFRGLVADRMLTGLLYNTPALVALDEQVLDERGAELAALQQTFAFLQDAAGTKPLTSFERLGGSVQRTVFGDGALTVTANFGDGEAEGVPAGCLVATTMDGDSRSFCP